jgi:hypothetical protein
MLLIKRENFFVDIYVIPVKLMCLINRTFEAAFFTKSSLFYSIVLGMSAKYVLAAGVFEAHNLVSDCLDPDNVLFISPAFYD